MDQAWWPSSCSKVGGWVGKMGLCGQSSLQSKVCRGGDSHSTWHLLSAPNNALRSSPQISKKGPVLEEWEHPRKLLWQRQTMDTPMKKRHHQALWSVTSSLGPEQVSSIMLQRCLSDLGVPGFLSSLPTPMSTSHGLIFYTIFHLRNSITVPNGSFSYQPLLPNSTMP